jgi:hypothetical protein
MTEENYEGTGKGGHQRESTPLWFLILCLAVAGWVVYYVYNYWGGLGPGLGY